MKYRPVIIEGPDGSGKTTLLENLKEQTGIPQAPKQSKSEEGPVKNLRTTVEHDSSSWDANGALKLYDRHALISDYIYGPICRKGPQSGMGDRKWFRLKWNQLMSADPVIIFCLPPLFIAEVNVRNQAEDKPQMPGVVENYVAIWWAYWWRLNTGLNFIRYDYTASDSYAILRGLLLYLKENRGLSDSL